MDVTATNTVIYLDFLVLGTIGLDSRDSCTLLLVLVLSLYSPSCTLFFLYCGHRHVKSRRLQKRYSKEKGLKCTQFGDPGNSLVDVH